jgi:hypothetical protein
MGTIPRKCPMHDLIVADERPSRHDESEKAEELPRLAWIERCFLGCAGVAPPVGIAREYGGP